MKLRDYGVYASVKTGTRYVAFDLGSDEWGFCLVREDGSIDQDGYDYSNELPFAVVDTGEVYE